MRRRELLDRAVAIFSADARFPAGWLEGSLADGSADSYSDIDLHLCVVESAWDEVWNGRLREIEFYKPDVNVVGSRDFYQWGGPPCPPPTEPKGEGRGILRCALNDTATRVRSEEFMNHEPFR